MKLFLTAAGAALLLAGAANAAGAPGAGPGMGRADVNGDGKVSLAEFKAGRVAMMLRADTNKDGKLSKAEMDAARARRGAKGGSPPGGPEDGPPGGGAGQGLARLFPLMDANHDGFLDKAEIGKMAERRFQRMDVDGDGVLSASELAADRQQRGMGGQGGAL